MPEAAQKIVTVCTLCNSHLRINAKYVSSRIRCPKCNGVFEVKAVKFGDESEALASRDALATTADTTPYAPQQTVNETSPRATSSQPEEPKDAPVADAEPNSTELSKKIGRYTIESEMGRGAFGVVYAARDSVLQRQVAIKLQTRPQDESSIDKMLLEARAAAKLRHPNIVAVFEVNVDRHKPFVVSELIDGQSLAERIAVGPMEPSLAATLIRDIARGLAYAHSEGLIHRDVKPQNILIDSDDRPQLTDFGLAVDRNDEQQREAAAYSRSGTLAYMAPEQAGIGAASVAPAVDQYALAATLFEMLCGQRPHQGGSLEIIAGLEKPQPPRVRSVRAEVPFDLDAICFKAMSHEPWNRYASCDAFADDLDRFLAGDLIQGRKIGLVERIRHYSKKHPRVAAWITGGAIAASGLLLATSTLIIRKIYFAQKQAADLQSQIAQANADIRQTVGIKEVSDGSAASNLPLWVAYSRKLNSAAKADSIGDKQLYGKLLDESHEKFRGWEYRHLEARRQQGLISTFTIDDPYVSKIICGSDNASVVIQSSSSASVKHYSIRDGALLAAWNAELQAPMALAHHSPTAYYGQPNTNLIKVWNWNESQPGVIIQLPFPADQLLLSPDDKWLYAKLTPDQQFALVNLETKQLLYDPTLKNIGLPTFVDDSSALIGRTGQQIQRMTLGQKLQTVPLAFSAANVFTTQVLGSSYEGSKISVYHAEQAGRAWSIRKDGIEIASLEFQPQTMRYSNIDGEITLCSNIVSSLQIAKIKPSSQTVELHRLHTDPLWVRPDMSPDGRLVVAVAGKTVSIWDTQLLTPQEESANLGMVRSMAIDGQSPQSIVLQYNTVSAVDIETGKVMWSREDDQ